MTTREWVFTDESGTHGRAKWCLVAGYRGSPGQWARFESSWNAALAEHRVRGSFHAREFFNRENWTSHQPNQFVGWTQERARDLIAALQQVFRSHRVYLVGGAVDVAAFEAIPDGDRAILVGHFPIHVLPPGYSGPGATTRQVRKPEPYMLAYHMALSVALGDVRARTQVHMKIAQHQQYGPRAVENFWVMKEAIKADNPERASQMKDISTVEPIDAPGVQAADILCFLWYRVLLSGVVGLGPEELAVYRAAVATRQGRLIGAGTNEMRAMLNNHDPELRSWFSVLRFP